MKESSSLGHLTFNLMKAKQNPNPTFCGFQTTPVQSSNITLFSGEHTSLKQLQQKKMQWSLFSTHCLHYKTITKLTIVCNTI